MRFVLATANPGKIEEMRKILSDCNIEIVTRDDCGINVDIEESGTTFLENAVLKARAICEIAGLPAIADDSGLMVDSLDGGPGVCSSSYGGEKLSDEQRCAYLLNAMEGKEQKSAKFVCTIVCYFPDGKFISSEGECSGEIVPTPRGNGGFGYDPIFLVKGTGKTMAQLTPGEKNIISHRGQALRKFASALQERGYR